jgi:hypothetical protein
MEKISQSVVMKDHAPKVSGRASMWMIIPAKGF